jgi:tetrahydromethanopterin S-methyltransferase subunit B
VSKNVQKTDDPRVGFSTNFLKTVNHQPGVTNLKFGFFDGVLIVALIAGTIIVMRLLLAH